ncbi:alpha-beta hydrolase superfamily lysophospholipase [Leeuwenhoekiella aestuarii]|uniref:Alpha-beta hydrolase superfamily lysophospholipase n=1 Tax=Leeuwenhoekiella aestuarii TaxID=2249426 RepID=A0A4Q0NNA9_9FLAO|nr:alpha-beta hydrolase superfamily lysophospholipase [Leeuwenhoekiella aestuarii]RXG12158.1 alpha-beta hydrolase superfamily lysophospholipase [Leeuwenhoekiella aestuarii]
MSGSKKENLSDSQIDEILENMSDAFKELPRSPILHKPTEVGLFYEDITFPSIDGVPIEGWFIPAEGSDKIIIINHPMGFTRSGLPSHLEPWKSIWQASGNDMEVNFIPDLKILHEAGFNILAYDLRNHGHSGTGNGGLISTGIFESRDVLGSIRYVRERHETKSMRIALFSRCLGADATLYAMKHNPKDFEHIRCLVAVQPLSEEYILTKQLELAHIPKNRIKDLDHKIIMKTSFSIEDRNAGKWAKAVCIPTFIYQVNDDLLTDPADVQGMYDDIPLKDKKLQWIYDTTARWDGYLEFQRRPEPMLKWFDQHM